MRTYTKYLLYCLAVLLLFSCNEEIEDILETSIEQQQNAKNAQGKPMELPGPDDEPDDGGNGNTEVSFTATVDDVNDLVLIEITGFTFSDHVDDGVESWINTWNTNNPDKDPFLLLGKAWGHLDIRYYGSGDETAWNNNYPHSPSDASREGARTYWQHKFYKDNSATFIDLRIEGQFGYYIDKIVSAAV